MRSEPEKHELSAYYGPRGFLPDTQRERLKRFNRRWHQTHVSMSRQRGACWRYTGCTALRSCLLPFYELPYISMIATISIILIEYRSVQENFKRKNSSIVDAMGLSERLIMDIVNAKNKEEAVKTISKIASELNNK